MTMLEADKPSDMKANIGKKAGTSGSLLVDQSMVGKFARATGDHQWSHMDVARARTEKPGRKTITRGYL